MALFFCPGKGEFSSLFATFGKNIGFEGFARKKIGCLPLNPTAQGGYNTLSVRNKREHEHILFSLISAQSRCEQIWCWSDCLRLARSETLDNASWTQLSQLLGRDFQFSETLSKTQAACASQQASTQNHTLIQLFPKIISARINKSVSIKSLCLSSRGPIV